MANIRMYVQKGCPHCEAAQTYFAGRKLSVESIQIGFDPILQAGIRASSNGQGLPVPIIVSFATQEVLIGSEAATLEHVADAALGTSALSHQQHKAASA